MKAMVGTRTFEDAKSWNGLVSRIVAHYSLRTTPQQRVKAADDLRDGREIFLAGVHIVPVFD